MTRWDGLSLIFPDFESVNSPWLADLAPYDTLSPSSSGPTVIVDFFLNNFFIEWSFTRRLNNLEFGLPINSRNSQLVLNRGLRYIYPGLREESVIEEKCDTRENAVPRFSMRRTRLSVSWSCCWGENEDFTSPVVNGSPRVTYELSQFQGRRWTNTARRVYEARRSSNGPCPITTFHLIEWTAPTHVDCNNSPVEIIQQPEMAALHTSFVSYFSAFDNAVSISKDGTQTYTNPPYQLPFALFDFGISDEIGYMCHMDNTEEDRPDGLTNATPFLVDGIYAEVWVLVHNFLNVTVDNDTKSFRKWFSESLNVFSGAPVDPPCISAEFQLFRRFLLKPEGVDGLAILFLALPQLFYFSSESTQYEGTSVIVDSVNINNNVIQAKINDTWETEVVIRLGEFQKDDDDEEEDDCPPGQNFDPWTGTCTDEDPTTWPVSDYETLLLFYRARQTAGNITVVCAEASQNCEIVDDEVVLGDPYDTSIPPEALYDTGMFYTGVSFDQERWSRISVDYSRTVTASSRNCFSNVLSLSAEFYMRETIFFGNSSAVETIIANPAMLQPGYFIIAPGFGTGECVVSQPYRTMSSYELRLPDGTVVFRSPEYGDGPPPPPPDYICQGVPSGFCKYDVRAFLTFGLTMGLRRTRVNPETGETVRDIIPVQIPNLVIAQEIFQSFEIAPPLNQTVLDALTFAASVSVSASLDAIIDGIIAASAPSFAVYALATGVGVDFSVNIVCCN